MPRKCRRETTPKVGSVKKSLCLAFARKEGLKRVKYTHQFPLFWSGIIFSKLKLKTPIFLRKSPTRQTTTIARAGCDQTPHSCLISDDTAHNHQESAQLLRGNFRCLHCSFKVCNLETVEAFSKLENFSL